MRVRGVHERGDAMKYSKYQVSSIELGILRLLGKGLHPIKIAERKGVEIGVVMRAITDLAERLSVNRRQLPDVWEAWVKGNMAEVRSRSRRIPKHLRDELLGEAV